MSEATTDRPERRCGILARNYRCFGATEQGFQDLAPINVIIGRNNTGKSALLDLVEAAVRPYTRLTGNHGAESPDLILGQTLIASQLQGLSSTDARQVEGKRLWWRLVDGRLNNREPSFLRIDGEGVTQRTGQDAVARAEFPLANRTVLRLYADRDMAPEEDAPSPEEKDWQERHERGEREKELPVVSPTGERATRLIHQFLHHDGMPEDVVERDMLDALNRVFEPEYSFQRLDTRIKRDGRWEIILDDAQGRRIPLSRSGSGVKTVLLVLTLLLLVPKQTGNPLDKYMLCLEEIENNLHPAALRRLLGLLSAKVVTEGCVLFLTTHSSVAIDYFRGDSEAQLLHVMHDGDCASVRTITSFSECGSVLDDLGAHASDLLQANGIIWVEGPSDRLYVNRWIELWDHTLREGAHYQVAFYAGSLRRHLTAEAPTERSEATQLLAINRNIAFLMDSDRDRADAPLDGDQERLLAEVAQAKGFSWVTAGREVENYVPRTALDQALQGIGLPATDAYTDIPQVLEELSALPRGMGWCRDKVRLAQHLVPLLTRETLAAHLDLAVRLEALCERIRRWNGAAASM